MRRTGLCCKRMILTWSDAWPTIGLALVRTNGKFPLRVFVLTRLNLTVCMYLCIWACVYLYVCSCVYVCVCACACVCVYVYACMCTDVCVCMYVPIYMRVCAYNYACMSLYACIWLCTCDVQLCPTPSQTEFYRHSLLRDLLIVSSKDPKVAKTAACYTRKHYCMAVYAFLGSHCAASLVHRAFAGGVTYGRKRRSTPQGKMWCARARFLLTIKLKPCQDVSPSRRRHGHDSAGGLRLIVIHSKTFFFLKTAIKVWRYTLLTTHSCDNKQMSRFFGGFQ